MKQGILDLAPPLTVAAILLFWANAPKAWVDSPSSILGVAAATLIFVQGLEFLAERHAGWRINAREFGTDLFYVVFGFTAIAWLNATLVEGPLKTAKAALGLATPGLGTLPFLVQVLLVITLIEFGQYWMHRLMHNNALFWSTHAPHHHITQLNAMKGSVGNPVELFLISLSVVALLDFDKAAMFAAFTMGSAIAIYAHANVRADPPPWYGFFFTTIRHHSLHHTALSYEDTRCNYGNSMIVMDRIFGTFRQGESSVVGQGDRKRLSIPEQWRFPFEPLIARIKARGAGAAG